MADSRNNDKGKRKRDILNEWFDLFGYVDDSDGVYRSCSCPVAALSYSVCCKLDLTKLKISF
jgi:hypothetical protein